MTNAFKYGPKPWPVPILNDIVVVPPKSFREMITEATDGLKDFKKCRNKLYISIFRDKETRIKNFKAMLIYKGRDVCALRYAQNENNYELNEGSTIDLKFYDIKTNYIKKTGHA